MSAVLHTTVIPAKAGTLQLRLVRKVHGLWGPAFAGMTKKSGARL